LKTPGVNKQNLKEKKK